MRSGSADQSDSSMTILWFSVAVIAAIVIIWMFFKKELVWFYFQIKLYEINFISFFTSRYTDIRTAILSADFNQITLDEVDLIGKAVGNILRIPLTILFILLAILLYSSNVNRRFTNTYTMQRLAEFEKQNWPQVGIITDLKLNLTKENIDKGPWAMALTPMQFCKRFRLIEELRPAEGSSFKAKKKIEVILKRGKANAIFSMQLGPLFEGIEQLPPYALALFAVFAARINGDTKSAYQLLEQLAKTAAKKLDITGALALCQKHAKSRLVQTIIESHAYTLTLMASLLEAARTDGVQASADFLWLKIVDRKLWYMLNSVGRQTPFVEIAGAFAHWLAEKEFGRKLIVPMIDEATNALDIALKEIIYRPDEA